jgi:intein/homing endonuclease
MNWAYIAGFFDGEGCIRVARAKLGIGITLQIVQVTEHVEVLNEIAAFLKGLNVEAIVNDEKFVRNPRWRPVSNLTIRRRDSVMTFLRGVLPYIYVKKVSAQDALRFLRMYPSLRYNRLLMSEGQMRRRRTANANLT